MVCYDRTIFGRDTAIWKSGIWGCKKNQNIEKIAFKVVQMKFLAMYIANQKLSFDIYTVGNLQNIFMEHDLYLCPNDFWHKRKINNFDPYNVFLAIATNIPQWLKTGFVVQGHTHTHTHTYIYIYIYIYIVPWKGFCPLLFFVCLFVFFLQFLHICHT